MRRRAAMPENLARKATASATSEHNQHYLAKFAVDGKIPPAGSHGDDLNAAWCVLKAKSGDRADFTLAWPQPVELCEVLYFGRTSWFMEECWKDYEVYLDDAKQPAAKGTFEMVHGPQRIKFAKTKASKVTIKFLNSYGGMNPGAAEIMVFAESPAEKDLAQFARQVAQVHIPRVDQVDRAKLRQLIVDLLKLHGPRYAQGGRAPRPAWTSWPTTPRNSRPCNARCCCSTWTSCWSSGGTRSRPRTSTPITTRAQRRRRAVRRLAPRSGGRAGRTRRLAQRADPGLRPVLRRHGRCSSVGGKAWARAITSGRSTSTAPA